MQFVPPGKQPWIDGCFFVWVSVFNLFATAVFWGFMTDLFTTEQGKRLFGFIAVGGSLGGILGPIITASLVHRVSTGVLLLICAAMLEIAAQTVRFFPSEFRRHDSQTGEDAGAEKPIGGNFWDGVTNICKSPYLFGLFLFILLYTLTSTWAYFQQAELTKVGFVDRAARTAFFAKLDLSVNTLTLLLQIFLTGRLMKFLGVTVTLLFMERSEERRFGSFLIHRAAANHHFSQRRFVHDPRFSGRRRPFGRIELFHIVHEIKPDRFWRTCIERRKHAWLPVRVDYRRLLESCIPRELRHVLRAFRISPVFGRDRNLCNPILQPLHRLIMPRQKPTKQ